MLFVRFGKKSDLWGISERVISEKSQSGTRLHRGIGDGDEIFLDKIERKLSGTH